MLQTALSIMLQSVQIMLHFLMLITTTTWVSKKKSHVLKSDGPFYVTLNEKLFEYYYDQKLSKRASIVSHKRSLFYHSLTVFHVYIFFRNGEFYV